MDTTAKQLIQVVLPRLAASAGVAHLQGRIQADLSAILERLPINGAASSNVEPRTSNRAELSSTLTGENYPVEIGVIFDGGQSLGLKHTVDLFPDRGESAAVKTTRAMLAETLKCIADRNPGVPLDECFDRIAGVASAGLRSIYLSTTYLRGIEPRTKVYLAGNRSAFGPAVVESLARATQAPARAVLRAMEALGKESVDPIGMAIGAGRVTGCKCYLVTPYLHFGLVKRLVDALDLSVGHALALTRWYRLFIGPHGGHINLCGIGLDLGGAETGVGLEAYTAASSHHIAKLRRTVDALWGRAKTEPSECSIVEMIARSSSGCDAASLHLAGCGVEVGPFGRFGRGTVYFHVANGQNSRVEQTLTLPVTQSL